MRLVNETKKGVGMLRRKWKEILMSALVVGILILAGCADNSTNNNNPGPGTPPIVGTWNGTAGTIAPLGVDEMKYFFNSDSTYQWYRRTGTTQLREYGSYRLVTDSIRFHVTREDTVTT